MLAPLTPLDITEVVGDTPLYSTEERPGDGQAIGNSSGHPGLDGAQDPRRDGAHARLRDRAQDRAAERRGAANQPGNHLSVPDPPRAERLDQGTVGRLG